MPALRASVWLLLPLCLAAAAPSDAQWRRIDTPNFVVIGEVGARDLRDVAGKFEAFREVLSRVLVEQATATAVPTVVIVFRSDRAFTPFKPTFQGKPVQLGGFFVPRRDINYIALVSDRRGDPFRIVFHEYAHLVVSNVARGVPLWLDEGLAELYSTFETGRGGSEAVIGLAPADRVQSLVNTRWLSLDELLSIDAQSPLYNEGDRRSVFYAQAWALTHFILLGQSVPMTELSAYLQHVAMGVPPADAWQKAFGAHDMARELERYVRLRKFRAIRYSFRERLATFDAPVTTLMPADAEAFLSHFLVQQRRFDEAAERIAAALQPEPDNRRLRTIAALLEVGRQEHEAARARLLESEDLGDWVFNYLAGTAVADHAESRRDWTDPRHLDAARQYFEAARRDGPETPNALARMVALEVNSASGPSTATRAAIERARGLAPGRDDYALLHAQVLARQSQFAAARAILGPLMSRVYPPDTREAARSLMTHIVAIELATMDGEGREVTAAGVPGTGPPADAETTAGTRVVPVFRELQDGEQRLEGELSLIECASNGAVVLHVQTADDLVRLTSPRMTEVDFIAYRDDVSGGVQCGPQNPPMPAFVTWRAGDSGESIAVAVELLPVR